MAVSVKMAFSGLSELQKALKDLPRVVQEQIVGEALSAGGEVIRAGAAKNIRSRSGRTADAIVVVVQTKGAEGAAAIGATPKRQHVLKFLEFGTKPHPIPKPGKKKRRAKRPTFDGKSYVRVNHPGIKPQAPLTVSLGENHEKAVDAFRSVVARRLAEFCRQRNRA